MTEARSIRVSDPGEISQRTGRWTEKGYAAEVKESLFFFFAGPLDKIHRTVAWKGGALAWHGNKRFFLDSRCHDRSS